LLLTMADVARKEMEDGHNARIVEWESRWTSLPQEKEDILLPEISRLQAELARARAQWSEERLALQREVDTARASEENMDEYSESLKTWSESQRLLADTHKADVDFWRAEHSRLNRRLAIEQRSGRDWYLESEILRLQKENDFDLGYIRRLQGELHKHKSNLIPDLKKNIANLEQELRDQAPLVDIGVAIRTRFLEQERINRSEGWETKEDLRRDLIDQGNATAHCGNGIADSALFKLGRVGQEFEHNDEVDSLLVTVGEMTEEIVSSYRQRATRRR
jgi:hypothetical protein